MTESQPQSISEADFQKLCNQVTETQASLLNNFHNFTPAQRSSLEPKLQTLQDTLKLNEIFTSFQSSLKTVDKTWLPKGRIESIIRACINQRYPESHIEWTFYSHGGINAVLVLHLGTRFKNAAFGEVYALPKEMREELAKWCGEEEINPIVKTWIEGYDRSRSEEGTEEDSPRLDRFAKDREKRIDSQDQPSKRIRTEKGSDALRRTMPQTGLNAQHLARDTMTCLATFPSFHLDAS